MTFMETVRDATIDAERLWARGEDSLSVAEALRHYWPWMTVSQVEPIVCKLLHRAREERRKGRAA